MDEIESGRGLSVSESAVDISEFEAGLRRARELLRQDDPNGAVALLGRLEAGYLRGAEVFLLLGEAFQRLGHTSRSTRYKTLYDILKANFGVLDHAESRVETRDDVVSHGEAETSVSSSDALVRPKAALSEEDETPLDAVVPLTTAMAEELARQGHYKRALEIYDRLLARDPEDATLLEAKGLAMRKAREKRVLGFFEVWLKNIERMKGELTEEA